MEESKIYYECPRCCGTGVAIVVSGPGSTTEEDPCSKCDGLGLYSTKKIDVTDIVDLLNDILDKCNDIFEAVTEE